LNEAAGGEQQGIHDVNGAKLPVGIEFEPRAIA
jgi:hypothetical protein